MIPPTADSARVSRVREKTYRILRENRVRVQAGGRTSTFTTPSLSDGTIDSRLDYSGKQWLWDSCAHAMILAHREPGIARAELRAMLAFQNLDPDSRDFGFVPHMNYFRGDGGEIPEWARKHFEQQFLERYWSCDFHSDITQPPILAMAVLEVVRATEDLEFGREMLPGLQAYYDYLHRRRADSDGLLRIIHPWESGWDNSQRWDQAVGLRPGRGTVPRSDIDVCKIRILCKYKALDWNLDDILRENEFVVKPVDFNVLFARNMTCLSALCSMLGESEQAEEYSRRSRRVADSIFHSMWNGDYYVDLLQSDWKSEVKSAAMFYPMLLDSEPHGKHLVHRHLANPAEFAPVEGYMVPTTSLDHPAYQGAEYWRGNVWGIVNFFVHAALRSYLFRNPGDGIAENLSRRLRDSMFELLDEADFFEYFNPQRVNDSPMGYGVHSFAWNGLALLMDEVPSLKQ